MNKKSIRDLWFIWVTECRTGKSITFFASFSAAELIIIKEVGKSKSATSVKTKEY